MAVQEIEYVTKQMLDEYIAQAAKAAAYEKGFGILGCDLSMPVWWAAYCRQSLEEQSHNNRLPEYLLTLAKMAKDQGVVVPREYVLYDHVSGEHLSRPNMQLLRQDLVDRKKVLGIFFADLRCLSREPAPQQVFERECEIRGVKLMFGDAPSGMDIGSQFARSAITFSNKLTRLATHSNARAGNVGRVLRGLVPACKAAYGYSYQRDAEVTPEGKLRIKKAWWDVDKKDSEETLIENSPAWVVTQVFRWVGVESRTSWWVAKHLNDRGIKAPQGGLWSPNGVCKVVRRVCYTGKNAYNSKRMVPNPARPLGDVTRQVKRTILRPKPAEEWVFFNVPQLIPEELWQRANAALTIRGRGRGKQGKTIQALLRNRIYCPRCGLLMVVRREGDSKKVYYHCARHYRIWDGKACGFRKFIPASWDEYIWDYTYALLMDNSWLERQLATEEDHQQAATRLIHVENRKIGQLQATITKVQTGYEEGIYGTEEAKNRIRDCQKTIVRAEEEIKRLQQRVVARGLNRSGIDLLKSELESLRRANLESASFDDKLRLMSMLDIRVCPSEDLTTVRIKTRIGVDSNGEGGDQNHCRKVLFAPP
jgi:hypothetical protein